MSLGPKEAVVKLTLGGVLADEFYARYTRAVIHAMNRTASWLETLDLDFPEATGTLKRSLEVKTDLYGQEKSITFQITTPYARYILETGREPGRRPPWDDPKYGIKQWAMIKGIPLRKARAWWWKWSKHRKVYRGPKGQLTGWWSEKLVQLRYVLERELQVALEAAGFSRQDVQVTYS
jgi:hypothetical protein